VLDHQHRGIRSRRPHHRSGGEAKAVKDDAHFRGEHRIEAGQPASVQGVANPGAELGSGGLVALAQREQDTAERVVAPAQARFARPGAAGSRPRRRGIEWGTGRRLTCRGTERSQQSKHDGQAATSPRDHVSAAPSYAETIRFDALRRTVCK